MNSIPFDFQKNSFKKKRAWRSFSLSLFIFSACGDSVPDLDVSVIAGYTDGRNPIGMVSVEGGSNNHCSAFLMESGNFITDAHCVHLENGETAKAEDIQIHMKNQRKDAEQRVVEIKSVLSQSLSEERDYVTLEPADKFAALDEFTSFPIQIVAPDEVLKTDKDLEGICFYYDSEGKLQAESSKIKTGKVYRAVVANAPDLTSIPTLLKGTFESDSFMWIGVSGVWGGGGGLREDHSIFGGPVLYKGKVLGIVIHGDVLNRNVASDEWGKIQWFPGVFD